MNLGGYRVKIAGKVIYSLKEKEEEKWECSFICTICNQNEKINPLFNLLSVHKKL